ncbi:Tricarboxylate/iron carrier [Phakopsora pachyrhizi]|uniref:Tricarboxylate/iron carrier n=1 Tax=Phakopsora pachyrhizi TaxID=170000 RepID=A0AAV0BQU1_PHAPC|nr:Tricarboxylate/iron carrier [Phakopsora pachyrhizi]CAH7689740.1 Tricarboxylate/iron carrier [Phakopsora pachyrhizi]
MDDNQIELLEPIDINKSRYDLNTYLGRLKHFTTITSPLNLIYSKDQIEASKEFLKNYKDGRLRDEVDISVESQERVWKAKQIVESSIHPETREIIPLPFRMSAFVPTNIIIATGLLLPNPTLGSIVGWQWANQTLNVCVNYCNSNKSTGMTESEILKAYLSATITSVGLAVGLNRYGLPILRGRFGNRMGNSLGRFIPFVAVASAGCVNVGLMRWKEIRDGIDLFTPGDERGLGVKSKVAGLLAVSQTAASRVLTNIPILILPPLVIGVMRKRGCFSGSNGRVLELVSNLGLIGGSLLVCLPPAIALFPQRGRILKKDVEPDVLEMIRGSKGWVDGRGVESVEYFEFNKGL